jgi:ribosomal protein S18 acetylase RimI-like enzyme
MDHHQVVIARWPGPGPSADREVSDLLAAYHLRTEAEKDAAVADVAGLPDRYRREILDPRTAFADDVVLVALSDASSDIASSDIASSDGRDGSAGPAIGCLVLTAPVAGRSEIKRLWADPAFRGQGVGRRLVSAALTLGTELGADTIRLSVWAWRTEARALYERLGFTVTDSWDEREDLICMQRTG